MMDNTWLERIKQKKSELKITNQELSEKTGIPVGTLAKLLTGIGDSPKMSNMAAICAVLGCSLDYIVTGEETTNKSEDIFSVEELRLVNQYRELDQHGRELADMIVRQEWLRVHQSPEALSKTFVPYDNQKKTSGGNYGVSAPTRRSIPLFDMAVSAGTGVYLDATTATPISIPICAATDDADYALRVSGNSMEPHFRSGDVILIQDCDAVELGELGIFVLDGDGFFKQYGGDRLLSYNKEYGPIMLKDFDVVECMGRFVGKLRHR